MKCIKCGSDLNTSQICVGCGSDLNKMKTDTQYLALSLIRSRQFMTLRSSASILMTVTVICCVVSLFTGSVQISLPILLTAIGIMIMGGNMSRSDNDDPVIPTAPANLFTAAIIIRSLSNALLLSLCIAVCVSGREVMEQIFSTEILTTLNEQMSALGFSITEDMLYMALYLACVMSMFICGGDLLMSGVEFIFMLSVRSSIKSGKVELSLPGMFTATLLIRAIFALFTLFFSVSFTGIALYGTMGYLYFSAYRCARSVCDLYK